MNAYNAERRLLPIDTDIMIPGSYISRIAQFSCKSCIVTSLVCN